jgi:hypothetical protein
MKTAPQPPTNSELEYKPKTEMKKQPQVITYKPRGFRRRAAKLGFSSPESLKASQKANDL